jgi:hypothetical protein
MDVPEMNHEPAYEAAPSSPSGVYNDVLLDLGDLGSTPIAAVDDLVLDLDYEGPDSVVAVPEEVPEAVAASAAPAQIVAPAPAHEEQSVAEFQQSTIISEAPAEPAPTASAVKDQESSALNAGLSPEAIDAIARRAVELMSEKVVREIAWEVVPELAELLIKKKLDEQN